MPNSGIAGSYGNYSFLRNLNTLLHSGCINLHSHQQWKSVFVFSTLSSAFIVIQSGMNQKEKNKYILMNMYRIYKDGTNESVFRVGIEM